MLKRITFSLKMLFSLGATRGRAPAADTHLGPPRGRQNLRKNVSKSIGAFIAQPVAHRTGKVKPCEAPGEEKGIKMASKLLPWVLQEVLFHYLCRKRRTFTKHCYLPCKTHIGKVLGALFYDLFLDNCRLGAYKNRHLQKNSKKGVSGRPWERQGAPMVSQSDTKWI